MEKLTPHSNFIVRENIFIHLLLGLAFLGMFVISLTNTADSEVGVGYTFEVTHLALLPAIYCFINVFKKRHAIFTINRKGFFYHGAFITDWFHFIDAQVTQDDKMISIQDNFVLYMRYRDGEGRMFRSKFKLTNTQDKAEEEIIAAIKYFNALARNGEVPL